MIGMRFTVSVHGHGTLAANLQGAFALPCPATLVEVSACGSNSNTGTVNVGIGGTSADDDGIMTAKDIGDSSAPAVFDRGDFDGALIGNDKLYHFARGGICTYVLAHGSAADVDLLFTFIEG